MSLYLFKKGGEWKGKDRLREVRQRETGQESKRDKQAVDGIENGPTSCKRGSTGGHNAVEDVMVPQKCRFRPSQVKKKEKRSPHRKGGLAMNYLQKRKAQATRDNYMTCLF